jgi:transposase
MYHLTYKVLQDANVKLSDALGDIFGVSGQLMLEALLKGNTDPAAIVAFAKGKAKKRIPQIMASLEQHQMRKHHRMMIRFSLEHLRFLEEQLSELDQQIGRKIEEGGCKQRNELLQTLPGVQEPTAAALLAEVGPDVKPFASEKRLSSWACVCPGNNRSAGKDRAAPRRRATVGSKAPSQSARGLSQDRNGHLREKFWRIATKSPPKAVVAVAHDLLILVYFVLQRGTPYEEKRGVAMSEAQKQRLIRHHVRRLGKLGIRVRTPAKSVTGRSTPTRK